jgi:hypothetical protein
MNSLACALLLLVVSQKTPVLGPVESSFDKAADFAKLRTYAWNKGQEAFDPRVHKVVVDAVEAQMTSLGFTKAPEASADVILKYHSVRGTYVDLKSLEKSQKQGQSGGGTETAVGTLVVVIYPRGETEKPLWTARTRRPLTGDAAAVTSQIEKVVADLFETYPTRKKTE